MDQRQAIEEKIAALDAQRRAIEDSIFQTNLQRNPNIALMPKQIRDMDHIAFQNALKPTLNQQKMVEKEMSQARADLAKYDRDQRYAATDQERARKATEAQKKAQVVAQKQAEAQVEDRTASAFGLGPKKGINYLNSRRDDLFYDPSKGKIGVPNTSPDKGKTAAPKGDPNAAKQVQAEISQIAKNAGVQGPVSPASFFDKGGFDMEQDDKGNYVYDANGTQVTLTPAQAERLQDAYNNSLAPTQEEAGPKTGVKYIPVGTFNQANALLNQVTGEAVPNPVERFLQSQTMNRQAQPAIEQAVANRGMGYLDSPSGQTIRPVPATVMAGQAIPAVVPERTAVPSISPGPDIQTAFDRSPTAGQFGASLLAGADPAFLNYKAKQEAERLAKVAAIGQGAQGPIPATPKELNDIDDRAQELGIKDPAARAQFRDALLQKRQHDEETIPPMMKNPITDMQSGVGNFIQQKVIPASNYIDNQAAALGAYLDKKAEPVVKPILRGIDYLGMPGKALADFVTPAGPSYQQLRTKYLADKETGAIGPNITLENYLQAYTPTEDTDIPEPVVY